MKIFPNLPAPVYDEVFSSWAYRCSMHRRCSTYANAALHAQPDWKVNGNITNTEDPDFDFETVFFHKACHVLNIQEASARYLFRPLSDDLVDWDRRVWFCPQCLRSDVQAGRLPAWRKNWCYDTFVFCSIHLVEPIRLEARPGCEKAWDAFVQICNKQDLSTQWGGKRYVELRHLYLTRIERWLKLRRGVGGERAVEYSLYKKLYRVFLFLPTRQADSGGVARTLFFNARRVQNFSSLLTFQENLHLGPQLSDPASRLGSAMLLAVLLGVVPETQMSPFIRYCEQANAYFPPLVGLEHAIYLGSLSPNEYNYLCEYLGEFCHGCWPRLEKFMAIQKRLYR
ncbi:TniQ family protein [Pseudomonas sp. B15(2017)]|uniref:TniQ family protein n=1 Tax=Pseudomonas sp. B15(2017) TaxID=1981744 RepID=UPI00111C860D|nr:TniQ family protein [Pseudomonas sp. B15(2017)]